MCVRENEKKKTFAGERHRRREIREQSKNKNKKTRGFTPCLTKINDTCSKLDIPTLG